MKRNKKMKLKRTKRIKEIQAQTGYRESISVQEALRQVWDECEQEARTPPQDWDILDVKISVEQRQALEQEFAELYERLKDEDDRRRSTRTTRIFN